MVAREPSRRINLEGCINLREPDQIACGVFRLDGDLNPLFPGV